jgi:hypothetical protein
VGEVSRNHGNDYFLNQLNLQWKSLQQRETSRKENQDSKTK